MSPTQSPTVAQSVLARLDSIETTLAKLTKLATFLATPLVPGEPNYLTNLTNLLSLLVTGTEETHKSLQELHSRIQDAAFARAINRAIRDS